MCKPIWPWHTMAHGGGAAILVRIERRTTARDDHPTSTQLRHQRALNEKLAYENALLKRMKFAAQSERHTAEQRSLLEEEIDADLAAVAKEIEQLGTPAAAPPRQATTQTPGVADEPAPARDPP